MSNFTRLLPLAKLKHRPVDLTLQAEADELAAVAARLGLPSVGSIEATLSVSRSGSRVQVSGRFHATIEQVCVVSLEPFQTIVADEIDEEFILTNDAHDMEIDLDPEAVTTEPLSGDQLDLGEIVIQNLSLVLDPHPRADRADLSDLEYDAEQAGMAGKPFAALGKLQRKR